MRAKHFLQAKYYFRNALFLLKVEQIPANLTLKYLDSNLDNEELIFPDFRNKHEIWNERNGSIQMVAAKLTIKIDRFISNLSIIHGKLDWIETSSLENR